MNGKVAKNCRRSANSRTVGMPTVNYEITEHRPKTVKLLDGTVVLVNRHTTKLVDCTRATYKDLKRTFKQTGMLPI